MSIRARARRCPSPPSSAVRRRGRRPVPPCPAGSSARAPGGTRRGRAAGWADGGTRRRRRRRRSGRRGSRSGRRSRPRTAADCRSSPLPRPAVVSRAISSAAGEMSIPTTSMPIRASISDDHPVPHPKSSTRSPGAVRARSAGGRTGRAPTGLPRIRERLVDPELAQVLPLEGLADCPLICAAWSASRSMNGPGTCAPSPASRRKCAGRLAASSRRLARRPGKRLLKKDMGSDRSASILHVPADVAVSVWQRFPLAPASTRGTLVSACDRQPRLAVVTLD